MKILEQLAISLRKILPSNLQIKNVEVVFTTQCKGINNPLMFIGKFFFAIDTLEEQPSILLKSTHLTATERISSATAGSKDLYRVPKCKA